MARDRMPQATVDLVLARATDQRGVLRCEACDRPCGTDHQLHHRVGRQMGGSRNTPWINLPSNVVVLCGTNASGCHGLCTETAVTLMTHRGWVVRRGQAARLDGVALVPVEDAHERRWLLADDGTKRRWTNADYREDALPWPS